MLFKLSAYTANGRLILFLMMLLFAFKAQAALIYTVNSESRTLSRIDTSTDNVQNNFAQLGVIPNKLIADENYLWVVNSGDNAVQKISRLSGATITNINIEASCNPWDAFLEGDFLYVTGLFTNKVYKVNTISQTVVGFVEVGNSPEALCVYNGKLYVTNTGGWQNNYANSSVSVIDLDSFQVIATIPVSANPQYLVEQNGLIHVSCTGNWINQFGAVCVIDPISNEVIHTLPIGGSLGSIWINASHIALVGDGSGNFLYRYNAHDFTILNDSDNPLTPGGYVVDGDHEQIALLDPNWGSFGKVRILHPDLTYWKEYNVGMAPTDMKLWQTGTALEDEVIPSLSVKVYPNPASRLGRITFETDKLTAGKLRIYNLKGQLVSSFPILSNKAVISTADLIAEQSSGCYFYRLTSGQAQRTGKFIIIE